MSLVFSMWTPQEKELASLSLYLMQTTAQDPPCSSLPAILAAFFILETSGEAVVPLLWGSCVNIVLAPWSSDIPLRWTHCLS